MSRRDPNALESTMMNLPRRFRVLRAFPVLLAVALCHSSRGASPPNLLFVSIDDLNDWGPSQLEGEPFDVETPNFDRLARRGILFNNAHCNAPSCNPSRTSILSGLHPASTGVYGNRHDWRDNNVFNGVLLLPEYFKKHGYATLGCGKIYHANQTSPLDRAGYLSPRGWDDFFPWHLGEKGHFSKFTLWEESTHVPLLIAAPGHKPGAVDSAVSLLDVYPTVVALAGLPANKDNEGRNLLPFMKGKTDPKRAIVTSLDSERHAVRDGRYRYLKFRNVEALFDHRADPGEFKNIANDPANAAVLQRLRAAIPASPHPAMHKRPAIGK